MPPRRLPGEVFQARTTVRRPGGYTQEMLDSQLLSAIVSWLAWECLWEELEEAAGGEKSLGSPTNPAAFS